MARNRDPFTFALVTLRQRAISGHFGGGRPIVILEEAKAISLSTTPVREALAWLGGEGLIERSGTGGYMGLRHDAPLVSGRYRLRLHCLLQAIAEIVPGPVAWAHLHDGAVSDFLARIMRSAGDVVAIETFERVQAQLGPLAAIEARYFPDQVAALKVLAEAASREDAADLRARLIDFHNERIAAAAIFAAELRRDLFAP